MGTWSEEIFGNDTACDWIEEVLTSSIDIQVLFESLEPIIKQIKTHDILTITTGEIALAACETVARLKGNSNAEVITQLNDWIEKQTIIVPDTFNLQCIEIVDYILSEKSELKLLWEEAGINYYNNWKSVVTSLKMRLVLPQSRKLTPNK